MNSEFNQKCRSISAFLTGAVTRQTWFAFAVLLFLNSVLRGIRTPGRWVCTELLINYDFGFTRRGLVGAIISLLNLPALYHYDTCFWYTAVVFSINLLLLIDLLRRLSAIDDTSVHLVSLLFASSLAVVMLANTIGYGDQAGLLLTLLALRIRSFYFRALLTIICIPACILSHDTNFVIFFPTIMFRFFIDLRGPPDRRQVAALSAVIIATMGTVLLVWHTHATHAVAMEMQKALQAKADYKLRGGGIYEISTTFAGALGGIAVWNTAEYRHFFFSCLIVTIPTTIYFMHEFLIATIGSNLLRIAGIAACLSPLSLHIIADDFNRWTSLSTTTSFLVLSSAQLCRQRTNVTGPLISGKKVMIAAFLVAMNLGSTIPLFDGYMVQSFPYEEHIRDVVNMIAGKMPFPPAPEQCADSGCMTVNVGSTSRSAVTTRELRVWRQLDLPVAEYGSERQESQTGATGKKDRIDRQETYP